MARYRALYVVLSLLGPTSAAAESQTLVASGRRLIEAQCARCHATDREAPSPHTAAPPFRQLAAKYPIGHLAEALAEGITTGHPDMPEFVFSTDEIAAILAYLERIAAPSVRDQ